MWSGGSVGKGVGHGVAGDAVVDAQHQFLPVAVMHQHCFLGILCNAPLVGGGHHAAGGGFHGSPYDQGRDE